MTEASLPMYDLPELGGGHARLWSLLRTALRARDLGPPASLVHHPDVRRLWQSPRLFLSQACGWPLVTYLRGTVTTLGTFDYCVPTGRTGTYRSQLVARAGPPVGGGESRAAVNSTDSLSGCISLEAALGTDGRWQGAAVVTGSHLGSLQALQAGRADVASIDAVTYALVQRHRPALLHGIVVIGTGPRVPCLPLIGPAGLDAADVAAIRDAVADVLSSRASRSARDALLINGFAPLDAGDYDDMLEDLRPQSGLRSGELLERQHRCQPVGGGYDD